MPALHSILRAQSRGVSIGMLDKISSSRYSMAGEGGGGGGGIRGKKGRKKERTDSERKRKKIKRNMNKIKYKET